MSILAYLDAGSGSMLVQAVIGGLAGLVVFIKYRWNSIRERLRRGSDSDPQ